MAVVETSNGAHRMQPLVTAFEDRTYRYTQLERQGDIAIAATLSQPQREET
jgi:hypothetical protein